AITWGIRIGDAAWETPSVSNTAPAATATTKAPEESRVNLFLRMAIPSFQVKALLQRRSDWYCCSEVRGEAEWSDRRSVVLTVGEEYRPGRRDCELADENNVQRR
ncbi:MAG: hypothetical protein ACREP9_13290, partial [Candidatus Dormibacteraceae bacterium]